MSVSTSLRVVRVMSLALRCCSSSVILRLTVGKGMPSFRPAAERLPVSTTVRKTDMACKRSKGFSRCLDVLA